jgi:maleylpyruvate isomerase
MEARAADIEDGAGRDLATQLNDLTSASARLATAAAEMPAEAWSVEVRWTSGSAAPAARVMWSRLREVEIHHADLDCGYTPVQWPEAFTLRLLRGLGTEFTKRGDAPAMVIRCPEVGHDITIGSDPAAPVVSGPAWAAAAWLIGRHDGSALSTTAGALPDLPSWG